ncbi:MAG: NADH-quinone oxidoreductase subunit NuoN [Rhodospirillaceae bacterium]
MALAQIPNLVPVLPEIFVACMIMALLMLGVFQKGALADHDVKSFRLISGLSILVLALTGLLVVMVTGGRMMAFNNMFVVDGFAIYAKVLILIACASAIVMSSAYMERVGVARFEFSILIVFATLGMMMMVSANDLISLYMGLEMQSLSLYVIASFQRDDTRSTEAGLKYFVLGALASGMLLYGASMVYGFTGSTNFEILAAAIKGGNKSVGLIVGIVFVAAGLAFKVSAVPFHMWTPDVYEGAPTPVTAFFAVAPKIAALCLFVRVMVEPFGNAVESWRQVLIFISVASMILGAVAAVAQTNIKRLMAYSSIGHVGYALIGLCVANETGVRGILVYLAIYLFMNVGAFACILCMKRDDRMVEKISDLSGLSKSHPMIALALLIFMFSMAGVPPLAGFFAKLYIFWAAIESGLVVVAVIGVLTSVIGAFYYLRIVRVMYFEDSEAPLDTHVSRELRWVILAMAIIISFYFVQPNIILDPAAQAASTLFLR